MKNKPQPILLSTPERFPLAAQPTKTMRARPSPEMVLRKLIWKKDKTTGLCYVDQTCSHTATFVRNDRPILEDLLARVILYATQCRTRKLAGANLHLEPAHLESLFPDLVFPDHLLQEIIDAPQNRTAKKMAVTFYAAITGKTESSIERDLSNR